MDLICDFTTGFTVFLNYRKSLSTGWSRMIDAGLQSISMRVVRNPGFLRNLSSFG